MNIINLVCYILLFVSQVDSGSIASNNSRIPFEFTKQLYNVYIPENSIPKTYATQLPGSDFMGIHVPLNTFFDLRYKIVEGDKDRFFKAEHRIVGDFCFLFIRIKTGNNDVLNRERRDKYILQIRASAYIKNGRQRDQFTSEATVVVSVLDTNDLNPLFYPSEYNATVFEDTPIHQSILRVVAEDADLGSNGDIYYSFITETNKFEIHPITGTISLSRPLKYEEGSYYELTVFAQDRGKNPKHGGYGMSKAKVRIEVQKVNFHSPEIRIRRHPQIVETSNADIYAIVHVSDKDTGKHGEIASLEIVDGDPDGHFRIRSTQKKGEYTIEVLKLLDREAAPNGYQLKLRARDDGIPPRDSYKTVPVYLADFNDNTPIFNKEIYEVKVLEIAPINTPLIRLKVTDADEGKNGLVFLEIVGGNEGGEFNINPKTGMLYTAVPLDAENKQFYSLTVSAIDQGNVGTRKQSSAKIKIYVEDTNDNDPIFEKFEANVWIDENMPAGTSVTTVKAKDRDRGENAYISYLIANLNKVPFEIDHFSGTIKTTQLLDYESMRREYILHIRASDWGLPYRRQTEIQLTVKIKDINDNRPQFEKIDCIGQVSRSIPIGSEIITLSAIDFDSGNIISYRIVSGNEDGCFSIDLTSGTISVICDLNDLKIDERELNVTATDNTHFADVSRVRLKLIDGDNSLFGDGTGLFDCKDTGVARRLTEVLAKGEENNKLSTQEFLMMPTRYGQNLHSPEFFDFPVEIKVNESVALGTTLVKLLAQDRDLGYNGKLVYGISGGDKHSQFCVDMDTGELRVVGYLDREHDHEYFLNITVSDLGKPQKSLSKVLPITVLDVNDNAPIFEKSLGSFRVTENAQIGKAIFKANATDADEGDNAKVTYTLVTDTKDFSIDKTTGVLSVNNELDRERQDLYEIRIRASDDGGKGPDSSPLFSDAVVRIFIDDINDNTPKFSLSDYVVKVREDVPKGTVVAVVLASDPDWGPEGEVYYSLENNGEEDIFSIDEISGTIITTKALDFEERQVHSLLVFANDKGTPSLSSEARVTIDVVDVNENMYAPQFEDFVLTGEVKENQPVGSFVMQANATDLDPPGGDSNIEYSIRAGDGVGIFSIDNEGIIRTLAVLDIETSSHYWITVFAQDHGVVPLFSSVEVFIEVLNENDNFPLSNEAVYYPSIAEESSVGTTVLQIQATDRDMDPNQEITYKIISGNPEGFFAMNSSTGVITTTSRKLDRETQEEHILEILINDNGTPPLSSITRVIVEVDDINDNIPEFEEEFYHIRVPAIKAEIGEVLFQVLAFDKDIGQNAQLKYHIKQGKSRSRFRIENDTGIIYTQRELEPGQYYEFNVKVTDAGNPPKHSICKVSVNVESARLESKFAPTVRAPQSVKLTEGDNIGFLVSSISANDADNNTIWFDIVGGNTRDEFYVRKDIGNVLIARRLDYEVQNEYCLNISVSDSIHTVYTQLNISVLDINDERPSFTEKMYKVEISEAVPLYTEILILKATDDDNNGKLTFSFHSAENSISLRTFMLNSFSGVISLAASLDRETLSEHILTVMVRDGATPAKKNFARVHIIVHDHNDHNPQFSDKILVGKVFESAAVGSAVLRAYAVDHDNGENARLTYSIVSGNVGNLFNIDPELGIISTAKALDSTTITEYTLQIKATDHGQPPLSVTVPAHIMITISDNEPPKFMSQEVVAEIYEDQPLYTYVAHFNVRSTSSLQFEILSGNANGAFSISPNTGVITTIKHLDYESAKSFNLSVMATNMASISATCNVIIHILDRNDNPPKFIRLHYHGYISESAPTGSLVLTDSSQPLVLEAFDADSEGNALLQYEIVESHSKKHFEIDFHTGAIKSRRLLDYETSNSFVFHVQISDLGKPRLFSDTTAEVNITVTDVNDCAPTFTNSMYNVTLLLPSYKDIEVIQLIAIDLDSPESGVLRYDIIEGNNQGIFKIDQETGKITLLKPKSLKQFHKLHVRVSDSKFSNVAKVFIRTEEAENSGLIFQKYLYEASVIENSTKINFVSVVNVLGSDLNEHIEFRILNPTNMFTIGFTSGVIRTTGLKFDRETQDKYELIVEARCNSSHSKVKVARVPVNITVLDINDNCPMFVNLPYFAVVSVDAEKGSVVTKVNAIDLDAAENGEVRYELIKGQGELFKVHRETGEIEIKQSLQGHNKEYELLVAACDKGITPCRTDVYVHIKVINRSMPVFKQQFYSAITPENIALHSPLSIPIEAKSPLSRKLIYSIAEGDPMEKFSIDFNSGVISVLDELDYEQQAQYGLIVRATDCLSAVYTEVPVTVLLQDFNDNPPEFTQESYSVSITEAARLGTALLTVSARDKDTGINGKILYSIKKDHNNDTDYFYIDEEVGTIFLKSSLDHEQSNMHHLIIVATDQGLPSISSTAHVWVKVLDMNDNPPTFDQSTYSCRLSVNAKRDQFVTVVHASDLDDIDQNNLRYAIVGGNDQQIFSMNRTSGIITLTNLENFGSQPTMSVNLSASDGVYTTFARLKVELLAANTHSPKFDEVIRDVQVPENHKAGYLVAIVNATDEDMGEFGILTYSICSESLNTMFFIDETTGKISTRIELDREQQKVYEILVSATDGGGLSDFMTVRVKVTDGNDNAPRFLLKEYKISIHSNYTKWTSFSRVKAVDNDEGSNAQLEYSLYEQKSSDVASLFGINSTTGDIYLLTNVDRYVGEVFQFFVRASDNGKPAKHSDVPVNVIIMGSNDFPPIFERRVAKFFLSENSPIGTVITRLKILQDIQAEYQIISDSNEHPQFHVDSLGQLSLARPLDFETQSSHLIGVLALTYSSPPLTTLAEIMLQVQDENDHVPQFESSTYIVYVAENIEEGRSILRVTAYDEDQGNNGDVRYDFSNDIAETSNFFSIDTHTGWITTIAKLDKETKSEHKFNVIANDNGTPRHSTRTRVVIRLKDFNDCPTKFIRSIYKTSVNEDALLGTVVVTLDTVDNDKDLSTPIDFYIISGDPKSHFHIRRTGEVYVAKPLDRETVPFYHLEIILTDGYFTDSTAVDITILDANDNPPFCLKHRYYYTLSEGVLPGSFVLSIQVSDIDGPEYSQLRYTLTGKGSGDFQLDEETGHLKTATYLDREKQPKYSLIAHVYDKDHTSWECSSQVELVISDLNDNAPIFTPPYYSISLDENVEVGTLVTKIHATDDDAGINRKIKYSFIDSFNDHFRISSSSGLVTLAKPLDREIKSKYNLTIQALDYGTPQLSSSTNIIVNVQDINDNPPEFERSHYFAIIPEIDAIGTEVVRVLATSKDIGANAEVHYSIIGGNEHKKFVMDNKTGVITVADTLDFERAKDYFLTIQAIDGGIPPLSNIAYVNISISDCNDNAPIFSQQSYNAKVKEDAQIGDKILQITATDLDSGRNGEVLYSFLKGNTMDHFQIDEKTGYVSVAAELDRETISSYVLEILARDDGLPVLSRQSSLNIEISDANDNPPLFSSANYTAVIQEDKPIGYSVIKFEITDRDSSPNSVPYTFDFRNGNEGNSFRLDQDGILRTATKFNHKIRDTYLLQIRVFDNGIPPLYSDTWVVVKVIEESHYPPIITPLEVNINSFLEEYPGGIIGKVYANDQDQYDTLLWSLSPTFGSSYSTHDLFQINRTDGTLTALPRLDIGNYRLNVTVTDGKFTSHTIVKISVDLLSEDMLENSVGLRFRDVKPATFVLSHKKGFIRAVKNAMKCRSDDVIIISVQTTNEHLLRLKRYTSKSLDVLFTVCKPDGGFFSPDVIRKAMNVKLNELEETTKLVVEEIIQSKCTNKYCLYGVCREHYVLENDIIDPVSTDVTSFVSPRHRPWLECVCREGYGGDKCDTIVNECARDPCSTSKLCIPDSSQVGYSCQCPEGYTGSSCDIDISKCQSRNCYVARNPISFSGKSYSQYRIINRKSIEDQLSLSFRIRTVQPTGNLMYAAGKVDYNILEVVNGGVQYRYDLGSGEGIVRVSDIYVSDGSWHEIKLERDRNTAKILIDNIYGAQGSAPGISEILNLQNDEMYLGAEVHQHPSILGFEDIQRGFSGCIDDIKISRVSVPLHKSGENSAVILKRFANVEFSCDMSTLLTPTGPCGSQPCMNGGTCKETKNGYECDCHERYKGTLCEHDSDPCASAPCLYGGKCTPSITGDFLCDCVFRLSGKRCEYGRYCSPNPCKHGGVCEEGDDGPLCKCRSFVGELCQYDLNECDSSPCQNGGTCVNEFGSFRCICPSNVTGIYCANLIFNTPISTNFFNITWKELIYISTGGTIIVLLIIICISCKCYISRKNKHITHNKNLKDNLVLNSNRPQEMCEYKRGSKLSNLEVNQREISICAPRPVSYTTNSQNDAIFNCTGAQVVLNNLDTLRSYGSAGDELENVPPDYVKNLNRNTPPGCLSNNCDLDKTTWAEQMHLASSLTDKSKIKNANISDFKIACPVSCNSTSFYVNRGNAGNVRANGSGCGDEEQRSIESYHWDCSDWVRHSQTLPNITEVPGSEVPDSSSFHSNESNESRCHMYSSVIGPIDSQRHIDTLNEDIETEFAADTERDMSPDEPSLNALNTENDEYGFTSAEIYIRHPNSYLPLHGFNITNEVEGDSLQSPGAESDDIEPYGFPTNRNRRKNCEDDMTSVITTLEERHSLLGGYVSNSDLSTNLCEIEDSECEAEHKPLNSYVNVVHQTSV